MPVTALGLALLFVLLTVRKTSLAKEKLSFQPEWFPVASHHAATGIRVARGKWWEEVAGWAAGEGKPARSFQQQPVLLSDYNSSVKQLKPP